MVLKKTIFRKDPRAWQRRGFYQVAILQVLENAEQQGKPVSRSILRRRLSSVGGRIITPAEFEILIERFGRKEGKRLAEWIKPLTVKVSSVQALIMKAAYYNPKLDAQEVINLAVKNAPSEKTRRIIRKFFERKPERVKKIIRNARIQRGAASEKINAEEQFKEKKRKTFEKTMEQEIQPEKGLIRTISKLIKALESQPKSPQTSAEIMILQNARTRLGEENSHSEKQRIRRLIENAEESLRRRGVKV